MKKHILAVLVTAFAVCVPAAAQLQLEITGGVNEADLYESSVGIAYGFGKVPITIGLKYGAEAPGLNRFFYNAAQSAGLYMRVEIPTPVVRPCVTAAGALTTFRGRCCSPCGFNPTQRCAYLQPGLLWQFHDAMAIRLDVFRFGWWDSGPGTVMECQSRWRCVGLAFTLKMF